MSFNASANTNPDELRRRLQASGPIGFILSVYETLKKLGRPYYYAGAVPDWLLSNKNEAANDAFQAAYREHYNVAEVEKSFQAVPHVIVHQYRMYPANVRTSGTTDSPAGARRQKTPNNIFIHNRPLPGSSLLPDAAYEYDGQDPRLVPAFSDTGQTPPLWDSLDSVPDLIRDYVTPDTVCYVVPWEYDVFVDFVLIAANMHLLEQMHTDVMYILRTFHDRVHTGASNLTGFFYQSASGAPPSIASSLRGDYPTRTITWRLNQGQAYAFPVQELNEIYVGLYGRSPSQ